MGPPKRVPERMIKSLSFEEISIKIGDVK